MKDGLTIRNLFVLSNGTTVIACDRPGTERSWSQQKVRIVSDDGARRQTLVVAGVSSMERQSRHLDQIAIETPEKVRLSVAEAQSGQWFIVPEAS